MIVRQSRVLYRRPHGGRMIEVTDEGPTRTLTFDSHLTQSRMLVEDPVALVLRYTRRLMAGLIFLEAAVRDQPFRVLMIGLGGGSLVKFLLHHFSGCRMDVVESEPVLPVLARRYFQVPDDPRLRVILEDGAGFMARESGERYDLILLDAFDQTGMVREVYSDPAYGWSEARLTARGLMGINLIRSNAELFRQGTEGIRRRFPDGAVGLSVPGFTNEIVFAGPGVPGREMFRGVETGTGELKARAVALEARAGLHFSGYLQEMVRMEGPSFWKRWQGLASWRV